MSLIHDALKKAEDKDKALLGKGLSQFHEPQVEDKPKINKRMVVLGILVFISLGIFFYTKFAPSNRPPPAAPAASAAPEVLEPLVGELDSARLKKMAVDAYSVEDMETAWSHLDRAAKLDSKDPEIWNNLGLIARKRGDVIKAQEAYQKALELKPEYPETLNNLAVLELQSGNISRAKELLEKALKISPAYAEANFHLALLFDQKGEKAKAVEYYKRFLEVGKNFPSSVVDLVRERVMEIETK